MAEPAEEGQAEQGADGELAYAEHQHGAAQPAELAHVDLEADDEQEQDQPDLRDQLDAPLAGDETEAEPWAQQHPARDVAEDERLAEEARHVAGNHREDDAEGDVAEQGDVVGHRSEAIGGERRRSGAGLDHVRRAARAPSQAAPVARADRSSAPGRPPGGATRRPAVARVFARIVGAGRALHGERRSRKKARISPARASGSSSAAKWPPPASPSSAGCRMRARPRPAAG